MMHINYIIALGCVLFVIGLVGVLVRRNIMVVLMALELMLNGVNIILIGYSLFLNSITGQIFVIFIIMMAVAEAAIGFALIISYFRHLPTYNLNEMSDLKG